MLERWGHVDVVVHNARYIGPGHMDRFLDTPIELLSLQLEAGHSPLVLNRILLAAMVKRGRGTIIDITSASGYADALKPAGAGGWGMGYGMSKAAFHRIAGFIVAVEHEADGIRCFNVQPGVIATERGAIDAVEFGFGNWGAPPKVVGEVVAWLATHPDADALNGTTIEAQFLCDELGLLPGWPEPNPTGPPSAMTPPLSGCAGWRNSWTPRAVAWMTAHHQRGG